jgi:hypothetical protein
MLALVLAVEAGIVARRPDLVSPWAEGWRVSAQAAETKAPGSDVLCFGDSLIKYGVLPKVIEARTGLRAYNLATSGGTIPSAFFLLRRALDAGALPRAVVVDFATLMDKYESRPKLLNYPDLATVRDCIDLAWASRDPDFLGSSVVSKVLPSYHYRFEVRSRILASLGGRSASERASVVSHGTVWSRELGAQPTQAGRNRHPQEDYRGDQPAGLDLRALEPGLSRAVPRAGRVSRDHHLLADAAALARGPCPEGRAWVGCSLRPVRPGNRGEAPEHRGARHTGLGL